MSAKRMSWMLSRAGYEQLIRNHQVLQCDGAVQKVLLLPDSSVVKLFRLKRWLSRALIYPRSFRFIRNARRLKALGILSVEPYRVFYCPSLSLHGVLYPRIEGTSLLDINFDSQIRAGLAAFIARLHNKGVYFRSLHPGNVLFTPDGQFALIDIADMYFYRHSLSLGRRVRNFQHLLRVPQHRSLFFEHEMLPFCDEYLDACDFATHLRFRMKQEFDALYIKNGFTPPVQYTGGVKNGKP